MALGLQFVMANRASSLCFLFTDCNYSFAFKLLMFYHFRHLVTNQGSTCQDLLRPPRWCPHLLVQFKLALRAECFAAPTRLNLKLLFLVPKFNTFASRG